MTVLSQIIPMLASYFDGGMSELWFAPVLALAFLATVPCIIKYIVR